MFELTEMFSSRQVSNVDVAPMTFQVIDERLQEATTQESTETNIGTRRAERDIPKQDMIGLSSINRHH
jgi:hypothetical protein